MRLQEINILALIFAALVGAIAGSLWYAIFLKGNKIVAEEKSAIKKLEGKPNGAFSHLLSLI